MPSNLLSLAIEVARAARAAGNLGSMAGPVSQFISSYESAQGLRPGAGNVIRSQTQAEQELRQLAQEARQGRIPAHAAERRLARIAELIGQVRREGNLSPGRLQLLADIEQMITSGAERSRGRQTPADIEEPETDIDLLGRGDLGYHIPGGEALIHRAIRTPESTNVYSFVYQPEETRSQLYRRQGQGKSQAGILYVTFKLWTPGMDSKERSRSNNAGPTYAYYDVPQEKYDTFRHAISSGGKGAGVAVWDYLRVRGSVHQHQHPYRLVRGGYVPVGSHLGGALVQEHGVYVPRKATARGFAVRSLPSQGMGKRKAVRSQLAGYNEAAYSGRFSRGGAEPNRGQPNTGRAR